MRILSKSAIAVLFIIVVSSPCYGQSAFSFWKKRLLEEDKKNDLLFTPLKKSYQDISLSSSLSKPLGIKNAVRPACFVPAFSANDLPFFCKIEYKIDRKSAMNFRFRVQSLDVLERY